MWVILGIVSAIFLGLYDISKKVSLKNNAVIPVLFFSTVAGFSLMLPIMVASRAWPMFMQDIGFYVTPLNITEHLQIFLKAVIVSSSWVFAYFAIKHLPISIVTPIRSSAPVWTFLAATIIFNERPTKLQLAALLLIFAAFYYFSIVGKLEGIRFHKDRWVLFTIIATLFGTTSALLDKYLIARSGISPITLQAWFSLYLVIVLGMVTLCLWYPKRSKNTAFQFRWSIVAIGFFLIFADFVYFKALSIDGVLLGLLSAIRRSSVIVSFGLGAIMFNELNKVKKAIALAGVLTGVFLILYSVH